MASKEIITPEFSFGVHIGNKTPCIILKRQLDSESVSWQYDSLWVVILPIRSQFASDSFGSYFNQ
jgi:hypothetical protein